MPPTTTVNLAGKTGPEIAGMIAAGDISQAAAEKFVADRAVRKLKAAQSKLNGS